MPRFPLVDRDLAVIVDETTSAAEVQASISRHGGELLRNLSLFDLYRGTPLATSEKSLAFRLVFGASDRTLTEAEIDAAVARVRSGIATDVGARIRS
jgi:phenylalanyl-tRNA synthetase beta chain